MALDDDEGPEGAEFEYEDWLDQLDALVEDFVEDVIEGDYP